jgi:signal transduction histidine kinase/CheY-like chemotaxis protein
LERTEGLSMASATEDIAHPAGSPVPQPLRSRLFMLVASGLFPLAIAALIGTAYLIQQRRHDAQRSALELSRALSTAVDSELKSTIGVLETLAVSNALTANQLAPFRALAQRVAERQGWRNVLLADPKGNIFLSSNIAIGGDAPRMPLDPASMQRALASRAPVIGRVVEGRRMAGSAFAVRVPVMKDGQLVNVISAVVSTEQVLNVLTRQHVPSTWVVAIYDQGGARVARSKFNAAMRPSPSMQALLDTGAREGMGLTYTLEGVPSFSGFSRLADSGWTVAVGISVQEVHWALLPLLLSLGAGLLASLALSAYLAWFFARQVSEPIHTLKEAADALGRGDRVDLPTLGIAELDEVAVALNRASAERAAAVTERRRAEAERERLLAGMTEALRLAEEAGRGKDEFLAVLGHELRNPLAPITTALSLMERKGDERTRPEREILQRQLGYMVRLVDDLLDVSRITGKRLAIRREPLRLAGLIEPVIEAARSQLGGRSLRVEMAPEARDAWVRGDEVRLAQILSNVLGNALKFTVATGHIQVAVSAPGDEVLIEIRDDGAGMPPEVLEHAFDPFFQAPQEVDRARGGLGLGLAIVRSLVELHGGSVSAASEGPGRGTTITLSVPRLDPPPLSAPPGPTEPAPGTGNLLVVDDNRDAADATAALLELVGYHVRVAYHPDSALQLLSGFRPDAALLDIGLPGMSGYELAAAMRGPPHRFTGLLVAVTGYGDQNDIAQALRSGFDAHLTKPVGAQVLLDLLASRLRQTG